MSVCLSVFYLIEQFEFFWQLLADVDLLYFHRGQPQHREVHALLFSNRHVGSLTSHGIVNIQGL